MAPYQKRRIDIRRMPAPHQDYLMTSTNPSPLHPTAPVELVLLDLLTALLDSWTLWNSVAGSVELGRTWRMAYLKATYGCGRYRPYDTLVEEAAMEVGLSKHAAAELDRRFRGTAALAGSKGGARIPQTSLQARYRHQLFRASGPHRGGCAGNCV